MTSLMGLAHGKGKGHATTSPNLIANGSFVGHADGWYPSDYRRTVAWNAGTMVVASSFAGSLNVDYRPGGTPVISVGDLTTIDAVGLAKCDDMDAAATINLAFYSDAIGLTSVDNVSTGNTAVGGGAWEPFGGRGLAVPEGATHVLIQVSGENGLGDGAMEMAFDDLYVGPAAGDAPPYPAVAIPLGERVYNGDFETNIADWFEAGWLTTLSRETADPITGTGSLKATSPGGDFGTAGVQSSHLHHVVIPGETLRVRFALRAEASVRAWLSYTVADRSLVIGSEEDADAVTGTRLVDTNVVIPATDTRVQINIGLDGTDPKTIYVDDVSLTAAP